MPVWHELTKELVKDGKLVVLGVIQEQHPERCKLFAQWKQFDWPILLDRANRLGLAGVPIIVPIDEHGVTRRVPDPETFVERFVNRDFPAPPASAKRPQPITLEVPEALDVRTCQEAVKMHPNEAAAYFRLGVAHQLRFESPDAHKSDFALAINNWTEALKRVPNQYIWRRRIQQFGPRLDKPYPFYDWVAQAQREITTRGEQPVKLPVPLVGAEIAQPAREFATKGLPENPDPNNNIALDSAQLVSITTTTVPHTDKQVAAARIHLDLTPTDGTKWSLDAGPLTIWIDGAEDVTLSTQLIASNHIDFPQATRRLEFEVRSPKTLPKKLIGYALYYICEESNGTCSYFRQDFEVPL